MKFSFNLKYDDFEKKAIKKETRQYYEALFTGKLNKLLDEYTTILTCLVALNSDYYERVKEELEKRIEIS